MLVGHGGKHLALVFETLKLGRTPLPSLSHPLSFIPLIMDLPGSWLIYPAMLLLYFVSPQL